MSDQLQAQIFLGCLILAMVLAGISALREDKGYRLGAFIQFYGPVCAGAALITFGLIKLCHLAVFGGGS